MWISLFCTTNNNLRNGIQPIIAGIVLIPVIKLMLPNVNLKSPQIGSVPTNDIMTPIIPAIKPFVKFFPETAAMIVSPKNASAAYSGGPKLVHNLPKQAIM